MKKMVFLLLMATYHKAFAQTEIEAPTNGELTSYAVVNRDWQVICTDPMVWNSFRGDVGYIVCQEKPRNWDFVGNVVRLPKQGILKNYAVQDEDGNTICIDPVVPEPDLHSANLIYCGSHSR